ncbi:M56 family metallopeptidase [Pedobacter gandavensis]|uniref:M56 family metallopeptidase n=1 Tax=Pedobacter gandavensis TaxID=2679963 RepID=UPI00292D3013|nr:M56 family metallopeptidase [Pedobacter gandavensis]
MEALALYLLKSALCIAVFYAVYWCFLKYETFFRFNRIFLIAGLICAVFLPLYTYTYEVRLDITAGLADSLTIPAPAAAPALKESYFIYYLAIAYALVACVLLARHVFGLIKIKKVIAKAGYRSIKECRLVRTPEFKSSFSVFNYIFFDTSEELSDTEKKMILRHELAHVKQRHWADLLLAQLFCTLQWFNPMAWLYLKAIRQNHEFLADEAVLQQGNSVAGYRAVLVNHYVGTRVFAISSSFYHFPQQRIKMLAKPASGWFKKMAVVMVLPAMAVFLWAFSEAKVVETTKLVESTVPAKQLSITDSRTHSLPDLLSDTTKVSRKKTLSSGTKKKAILVRKKESHNQVALPKSASVIPGVDQMFATQEIVVEQIKPKEIMLTTASPQTNKAEPLYLLDGVEVTTGISSIDPATLTSVSVLKNEQAITAYGEKGRNGVVILSTKKTSKPVVQ